MHTIENEALRVSVKTTGAELCSIQSVATGREYMWQADPGYWANHAPVLFPIIGGLKEGAYHHQGKTYSLPKHGFVRYNERVFLAEQKEHSLKFGLLANEETLQQYPFSFAFFVTFSIKGKTLAVTHSAENTGEEEMLFSLGGHPAFRCPFFEGEEYADYVLEFEQAEAAHTWDLDAEGLIAGPGRKVLENEHILPLHDHLFDHDALIFKHLNSSRVSLKSRLSGPVLSLRYEGWPYLGIWAKSGAPFVCIEPWLGIADSADTNQELAHKEGILRLPAGEFFEATYFIEIQA